MSKPLHAGKAAQNGLLAARLAARGFTSDTDILALGARASPTPSRPPSMSTPALARARRALGSGGALQVPRRLLPDPRLHRGGEPAADRGRRSRRTPIEAVSVKVPAGHLGVCNIQAPATGLECKFSLRMTTALAPGRRGHLPGGPVQRRHRPPAGPRRPARQGEHRSHPGRARLRGDRAAEGRPDALAPGRRLAAQPRPGRPAGPGWSASSATSTARAVGAERADEVIDLCRHAGGAAGPEAAHGALSGRLNSGEPAPTLRTPPPPYAAAGERGGGAFC